MVFRMMIFSSNIQIASDVEACMEITIVVRQLTKEMKWKFGGEQAVRELADQLQQCQFHQPGGIQGQLGSERSALFGRFLRFTFLTTHRVGRDIFLGIMGRMPWIKSKRNPEGL